MDPYERMFKDLEVGEPEVRKVKMDSLKMVCICPQCPTYSKYAEVHGETLYCFLGKTDEPSREEKGCICADCPVATEGGLVNDYYCIIGSEKEMRKNPRMPRGVRKERLY